MSFPRRNTRRIIVDGVEYLWHLNPDFDLRDAWIIIGQKGQTEQLVFLDPYHHDFLIGPHAVSEAIRFVRANGWQPGVPGKEMRLGSDGDAFTILPNNWVLGSYKYHQKDT